MSAERALEVLSALVLEDGRTWGQTATAVQRIDAAAILGEDLRRHWLGRSRGYSKTTDLAGLTVAAMLELLPAGANAFGLASDRDQAALLTGTMAELIRRTPGLAGAFDIGAYRVTVRNTGNTFTALAADAPGAWGLRPSWVVVDELCNWTATPAAKQLFDAVMTALPKVSDSRAVVITTPGDPAHWSHAVYERALAEPSLWRVSEVHGPPPWMPAHLVEAERRRLPESVFRRLFLGEWTAGEDRLVMPEDLAAAAVLEGPLSPQSGTAYAIGLDVGLKHDATVAAVVHTEPAEVRFHGADRHEEGQRVVLDRLEVWRGSRLRPVKLDGVEEWVGQAARSFNNAAIVADPWQAIGLCQRLRDKGLRVEEWTFNQASNAKLASTLHTLLRDRRLSLPDDADLLDELANVRLRETSPNVFRLDHDASRHDDRAVALALAATHLLASSQAPVRVSHYRHTGGSRGGAVSPLADRDHLLRKMAKRGDQRALEHLDRQRGSRASRRR